MTHRSLTLSQSRPPRVRLALAVAFLLGVGATVTAGPAGAEPRPEAAGPARPGAQQSVAFGGTPRVGALFSTSGGALTGNFCTAAVVASPDRDLLVTAAHCLVAPGSGKARDDLLFVPGYASGRAPYGRWSVRKVVVDSHWAHRGDPDYDVAFLTTAPVGREGRVQDVVGAEDIAFDARAVGVSAVAVGYPWHGGRPVRCQSRLLRHSSSQLQFDCPGLPMGTSGGPLLAGVDATGSGPGRVLGVIGGYQQGGDTDDISYSPYFGPAVEALYRSATTQG